MDLRDLFPVTQNWAFLDHAGVSAASAPAQRVIREFADDLAANGVTRVGHWVERCEEVRRLLGAMLHVDPASLAFVKNTTEAIDFVAEGLAWNPGDNVVLPADEYPSNQYPWINLAGRGVEARRVASRPQGIDLADLDRAIDARTRILAVSWVGYATGYRIDLDALVELAQRRNVLTCVDIIQGFGSRPLDLSRTPIDFAACGSHKWALGYQGAGFLYVRPERLELLRPLGVGAHSVVDPFDYSRIDFRLHPSAQRYEGGTLNFGGIAAWGASLRILHELGIDEVCRRIRSRSDHLVDRAERAGLAVFSDRRGDSGIVSLTSGERDPTDLMRRAKSAGVVVNCRAGRLRVAPHCYNNGDDIDRLLDAVT